MNEAPPVRPAGFLFVGRGVDPVVSYVYDGRGMLRYLAGSNSLAGPVGRKILTETLRAAGLKARTAVRRALKEQMGTKSITPINKGTRSYSTESGFAFVIEGRGKGLSIRDFPMKGTRSKWARYRWSPRDHWRVQARTAGGRFGAIRERTFKGVSASPWATPRSFVRSFVRADGEPAMVRQPGKRATRRLFGPAIWKELVKDRALVTFEQVGPAEVARILPAKMARLLP